MLILEENSPEGLIEKDIPELEGDKNKKMSHLASAYHLQQ